MAELVDNNQIYDNRTRQYFEEVMSSYNQGNLRSAVVMLYSVVLCDLMFKLQELRDVFADKFAKDLLGKIEAMIAKDKASPAWEVTMVDEMHKNSPLLESDAYAVIIHLRDWRNLSAHPVLDDYSQLFVPEKHLVEGYICEAFNKILSRPAIFVKDVVGVMSEDLNQKKGYILNDKQGFNDYLNNKYFQRMTDAMFVKVFKSFWRFTFILVNPDCDSNRLVNYHLLRFMISSREDLLLKAIDSTPQDFEIADTEKTVNVAVALLSHITVVWSHLSDQTRVLLNNKIQTVGFYKLAAWFLCDNKAKYIKQLINEGFCYYPTAEELKYILTLYQGEGLMGVLCDYFIHILDCSGTFTTAQKRMDEVVLPYLDDMSKDQIDVLLNVLNSNSQLYNNYSYSSYCRKVTGKAMEYFTKDQIQQKYPKIYFPVETPIPVPALIVPNV